MGLSLRFPWEFQENHEAGYFEHGSLELSRKSWTGDTGLGIKNIILVKAMQVGKLAREHK